MYSIKFCCFLIISALLNVNNCAPLQGDSGATILNYDNTNDGSGNYHFRYVTSNGITREEKGTLVDVGLPSEHISVQGSYSYTNPEGVLITLKYTADENGYAVLTELTSPPLNGSSISPAVLASLLGK